MNNRQVYILFSDTGSMLTKAINVCTNSTLNHASLGFDSELREVYSFGRRNPRNPFNGGFVRENVRAEFFRKATCAIYSFSVSEQEYLHMRACIREIEERQYKYNFIGLFWALANRELERKNAYFCSQFIAAVLLECSLFAAEKPACLVRPQDLKEWKELTLVYQGALSGYVEPAPLIKFNTVCS